MDFNEISEAVIGSAIEVHKHLGPGLLESVYQSCLCFELRSSGLHVESEVALPVIYKGTTLSEVYRVDMLVEDEVVVELKAVEQVLPVYKAQLLSYLKISGKKLGLLINFNVPVLKQGVKRIVNRL